MVDNSERSFDEILESMKTQRDELRVQLHLMKADLKDEWEELEEKWQKLEPELEQSIDEIGDASKALARELAEAYRRVRNALS